MKLFTDNGEIATIRANQVVAGRYYNASLEIQKGKKKEPGISFRHPSLSNIMMLNLDAQGVKKRRDQAR